MIFCCRKRGPKPPLYIVGDSIAAVHADGFWPRMGWGQALPMIPDFPYRLQNDAVLGASSQSYISDGYWKKVVSQLSPDSVVVISLGHNDQNLPVTSEADYKNAISTMVLEAREKHAAPVLMTSVNRCLWTGTTLNDSLAPFPGYMRDVASELGVLTIDMNSITYRIFQDLGEERTRKWFMLLSPGEYPNWPLGSSDETHLQEYGALSVAALFVSNFLSL